MFPLPNVWHEFQNEIENAGFYTHQRNRFIPPKFFAWIYRMELKVWILYTCRKFVSTPQMFGTNFGIELKKFYTHPRKMLYPLDVLHDYQDIVERVGFYTHAGNFAWLSGYSWKGWVLYTCQKYVSTPKMFGMNFGIELKMLGFIHIPEVCSHPNKCLAQISGENWKCWVLCTS